MCLDHRVPIFPQRFSKMNLSFLPWSSKLKHFSVSSHIHFVSESHLYLKILVVLPVETMLCNILPEYGDNSLYQLKACSHHRGVYIPKATDVPIVNIK